MASQVESWCWAEEETRGCAWLLWNGAEYHPKYPRVNNRAAKGALQNKSSLSVQKTTRIAQLPTPIQKLLATK
jgi:hypothetical protein